MSADDAADRPGWTVQAAETWTLHLPLTRAEAERVAAGVPDLDALDEPPVLVVSEPDPARPDEWRLDVYFEGPPALATLALVAALGGGTAGAPERVEDADWVTLSQAWLQPIRAGRFHVHTAAHAGDVPGDAVAFRIEAGRAFGTGHHETTAGCLEMLDAMAASGEAFGRIADVGTGTGLLAFAARALWPGADILATDIDPVAIPIVAGNMAANGIPADAIALAVADGLAHPAVTAAAPFDLLIANILAGPLIALAPDIARAMSPGGRVILAGLLATQEADVTAAFARHGLAPARRLQRGDWPVLALARAA